MKVLVDYHHGGLIYSLHLLFEKRLGWEMFRPIGMDWFLNGYFKVAEPYGNAQDTINQYLAIEAGEWHPYNRLNGGYQLDGQVYKIQDPENNFQHKAITFKQFKEMEFDLIVATFPLHENWEMLLHYQPKAKFIMQMGNENQTCSARNVMCSVWGYTPRADQRVFFYHQEIDTNNYYYGPPTQSKKITSFVIGLPEREVFLQYQQALSDYDFKAYGPGAIDGNLALRKEMGDIMRNSQFGWHIKPADGFGHLLHGWYACGKPVITRGNYYQGKTGGLLLEDQVTCIDIDRHSFMENIEVIRKWSEPENHIKLCQQAYDRFKTVVNYDDEAERFKQWLSNVI